MNRTVKILAALLLVVPGSASAITSGPVTPQNGVSITGNTSAGRVVTQEERTVVSPGQIAEEQSGVAAPGNGHIVLDVRPEHNDGRNLTMEEANSYKTSVYPEKFNSPVPEMTPVWNGAGGAAVRGGTRGTEARNRAGTETAGSALPEAFTEGNSLYIRYPDGKTSTVALSNDDNIKYGQEVSRNEFNCDRGIFWSPDRTRLAFYRKDESRVTEFPLLDISTRTGSLMSIKYPMNGMDSELLSLGIYDLEKGTTVWADVTDFTEERYLTNVSWSPDARFIFIQVLDREQHHMHLNMYSAEDGSFIKTILTEENEAWVEPQDPLYFIKNSNSFIYRTDNRDGYKSLYLCDTTGVIRRLTATAADVDYVANDGRFVYYLSSEVSPAEKHLFRVDLRRKNLKPERLTTERGWHDIKMNDACTYYIDQWSSFNVPNQYALMTADGRKVRTLLENDDPLAGYRSGKVEFGTVKSADGKYDNHYRLFYPADFDPSKKYPLVLYVYGGPHSQMVTDSWIGNVRMWEMYMAERGYFVYVQDNRGTPNHGTDYEKAINRQCGQAEMQDQMVGVRRLMELPYIDNSRIGVHGWSYGGFMTISLALNYPEVFKVAVAGGPVIDWKWYEVMYGERYMDNPGTNPDGFAETELVGKAPGLKAKLLICQGAVDNTVVWQHSLSFIQACISNNVPVDYFPYPMAEHNMRNIERVHLHNKITEYFNDYL